MNQQPEPVVMTVSEAEMVVYGALAKLRQEQAKELNLLDAYGLVPNPNDKNDTTGLLYHEAGVFGPQQTAKLLGRHYNVVCLDFRKTPQISGGGIVVRTRTERFYQYMARADDKDTDIGVHAVWVPSSKTVILHGWLPFYEAKQKGKWQTTSDRKDNPVCFVSNRLLRPMHELIELVMAKPEGGPYLLSGVKPSSILWFGGKLVDVPRSGTRRRLPDSESSSSLTYPPRRVHGRHSRTGTVVRELALSWKRF